MLSLGTKRSPNLLAVVNPDAVNVRVDRVVPLPLLHRPADHLEVWIGFFENLHDLENLTGIPGGCAIEIERYPRVVALGDHGVRGRVDYGRVRYPERRAGDDVENEDKAEEGDQKKKK